MKRLGIIRWKLDFVKIFVNRSLSVSDEYTQAAEKDYSEEEWDEDGEAEYENATDVLLFCQEIVCRAALGELNSLVEYELKLAAQNILIKRNVADKKAKIGNRKKAVKIILDDGLELEKLPGYSVVDEIRQIINSYKHDDGYSGRYRDFAGPYVGLEERYELQPKSVLSFIDSVDEFILALYEHYPDIEEEPRIKFNFDIP
jgi:uncharacterized protein YeeX (DUF496 family)